MKFFGWLIPWWAYAIAGALYTGAVFYAGFHLESLRWSASLPHEQTRSIKAEHKQIAAQQQESTAYENGKQAADANQRARETTIRTIYRDVPVPGSCAAPDGVRSVLQGAIDDANSAASGQPGAGVPKAP